MIESSDLNKLILYIKYSFFARFILWIRYIKKKMSILYIKKKKRDSVLVIKIDRM